MTSTDKYLRFVPSRVEGLPDVREVAICHDRLEVATGTELRVFRLVEMAQWPKPVLLRRLAARLGCRPKWLPVADRDWCHPAPDRYFAFYTTPKLVIYMPLDERVDYKGSCFWTVQEVIRKGGFSTVDLG